MKKSPGTAGIMPIEGAGCGVRPSKEAMEVPFSVDFSKAKELLEQSDMVTTAAEKNTQNQSSKSSD